VPKSPPKKFITFLAAASSAAFLSACISISERLQSVLAPAANIGDSVSCQAECKDEWQRAQLWIVKHSGWKIQIATDVVIQTYNPAKSTYGFSITREPAGGGSYTIRMEVACGDDWCDPKPLDARNAFYYYVKTGTDLLLGQGYLSAIR